MSEIGRHSVSTAHRRGSNPLTQVDAQGRPIPPDLYPVRIQCFRCPNRVYKYVKVHSLYQFRRGKVGSQGEDRQVHNEYWCLSCLRSATFEDDDTRAVPSVSVT